MKKLRTIIVAGLLVWVPLGATIFVLRLLIDLFGNLDSWMSNILGLPIKGLGILLALLLLLGTGLIAANYFGKRPLKLLLADRLHTHLLLQAVQDPIIQLHLPCVHRFPALFDNHGND